MDFNRLGYEKRVHRCPGGQVFAFLANPANWPQWAIVNVKALTPLDDEWWEMRTTVGRAKLRIRPNAALGTLDYDFVAPDAN